MKLSKAFFVSLESERNREIYEKELAEINARNNINMNSNQWKKFEENFNKFKFSELPYKIPSRRYGVK